MSISGDTYTTSRDVSLVVSLVMTYLCLDVVVGHRSDGQSMSTLVSRVECTDALFALFKLLFILLLNSIYLSSDHSFRSIK